MTSSDSHDNGPKFLSDLIRDMHHLRQQQAGMETKMARLSHEHEQCSRRLDAIEGTLRAIGCRESDLVTNLATAEGRRQGQNSLMRTLLGPFLLIAAWFLSLTWFSIQHAEREEAGWQQQRQQQPPQMGPPVPSRLQEKKP